MNELAETSQQCPYCGETITLLIDCSVPYQNYIEDCYVCCRPINIDVTITHDGELILFLMQENE